MYTFIIVEDEALIRKGMLKKIRASEIGPSLHFAGEAGNGEAGLELVQRVNPDIILTDMRMPEMDGKSFLKLLQHDYPEKKVVVISGYSDFEYMKEAISARVVGYLLKPFNRDEIRDILVKAMDLIEIERATQKKIEINEIEKKEISYSSDLQLLGNLILGIHHKEKPLAFRSSNLLPLKQANQYRLFTVYTTSKWEETVELSENYIYVPHSQNDHIRFFLWFAADPTDDMDDTGFQFTESIVKQAEALVGYAVIGVSRYKSSLIQLNEAYEETISALNERKISERGKVFMYTGGKSAFRSMQWSHMDELLFFIESGNTSRVTELTRGLFDFYNSSTNITISEIKDTCRSLIHDVRSMLRSYYESLGNDSSSSSFETVLNASFDINNIQAYLSQVLPGIADILNDKSVYASDNLIENIKTYIQKNFSKELTLEKISSLFFINPSYFSYLFKEKTGVNFIDYVNKVRIDRAKALLKNTDEKVYKIAKAVGYDNAKYFFRVFKKVTGYSPEEYRTTPTLY